MSYEKQKKKNASIFVEQDDDLQKKNVLDIDEMFELVTTLSPFEEHQASDDIDDALDMLSRSVKSDDETDPELEKMKKMLSD